MDIAPKKVERLLAELCIDLGCCIPPIDAAHLIENSPFDVDAFTNAVLEAEGCDDLRACRQVRERIAIHFRRWEDEAMQAELLDDFSRNAPQAPDA